MADSIKSKLNNKDPLVFAPTAEGKLARDANRYRTGITTTPSPQDEDEASLRRKIAEFETKKLQPVEYQAPDMEEGRTEYDSAVGEAKKAYHEERDMNELKESAGMIGKALAQYGAAVEGQKLGRPIGALDFGKGIDFGTRTQSAYRDYLDELKDLQSLRQEREKAKTTDARMKFDAAAKQQELEVETQLKGLNARLEMLKDKKRDEPRPENPLDREKFNYEKEQDILKTAAAEHRMNAAERKNEIDSINKALSDPKDIEKNKEFYIKKYNLQETPRFKVGNWGIGSSPPSTDEIKAAMAQRVDSLQAGGGQTSTIPSSAPPASKGVRMKAPNGEIGEVKPEAVEKYKSQGFKVVE